MEHITTRYDDIIKATRGMSSSEPVHIEPRTGWVTSSKTCLNSTETTPLKWTSLKGSHLQFGVLFSIQMVQKRSVRSFEIDTCNAQESVDSRHNTLFGSMLSRAIVELFNVRFVFCTKIEGQVLGDCEHRVHRR